MCIRDSTIRALVGNGKELANKPVNAILGHIAEIPAKGLQLEKAKKMFYMYGAVQETNARALTYMWETIKKANHDPDALIDTFRKDFSTKRGQEWTVLDGVAEHWRKTEDIGNLMQYDAAKSMDAFSRTRYSRFAMTGMTGIDGYTTSYMATMHARMRAYDEVLTEHGKVTPALLKIAEEKHYKSMFNSKGMLTDAAVRNATGAIMFSKELGDKLDRYHLLKHPFYQIYWNEGKLNREIIKDYAEQYYQHVKAVSYTHLTLPTKRRV